MIDTDQKELCPITNRITDTHLEPQRVPTTHIFSPEDPRDRKGYDHTPLSTGT